MREIVASMASAAMLLAAPAQAGTTWIMAPTGNWKLQQTEESCQLTREFGLGIKSVQLAILSFGSRYKYRAQVPGNAVPTVTRRQRLWRFG